MILFLLHGFAIFSFSYLFLVGLVWLIVFIFQLTPDVRQLHARTGHRRLHEVETMWPKAPASHLERPPQFVSVLAILFFFFLLPHDKVYFQYFLVLFLCLVFGLCVCV